MKYTKADSRFLSPVLFLLMGFIGLSIALTTVVFFGYELDIREQEANSIVDRIAKAVYEANASQLDEIDLLDKAGLERAVIESDLYSIRVQVLFEDTEIFSKLYGNEGLEISCFGPGNKAYCIERTIVTFEHDDKYIVRLFVGVK
jgi:hypothetical protein